MSEIIKFARENDVVSAKQIRQGQKALSTVQGVVAGPGIRAAFKGDVLSIGLDGLPTANRSGFMAKILDYDSTEKRYSFAEAVFTIDATGEGIAQLLGADPAARHSTTQYIAVELTGNVSVPIGAYVMMYPTMGTENGASLYIFAYGAVIMYCKVTSADWATPITGNPCDSSGANTNTAVTVTMNEPYRSTALLIRDIKNADIVPVIINTPYAGGGPFTITGDIVYQETTTDIENADDLDAAVDAWDCGTVPDGFTETLVTDVSFDVADDSFHKKTRLHTINEAGKVVHVGAEADTIWAYFDPGTGDSEIYSASAPAP